MSVTNIAIGVVVVILVVILIRYLWGCSNKLTGLKDAKVVTRIAAESLSSSNSSNYAYSAWFYNDV